MTKKAIVWLVIGCSLVLVGAMIFFGVMAMSNWNFGGFSTVKYQENEYNIIEEYKSISIESDTADILFVLSDTDKTTVTCYEENNQKHTVNVDDGMLKIKLIDTRKWYEHIGIGFGSSKITVSLPKGEYESLYVNEHTGKVEIASGLSFENMDITSTTGNVKNLASTSGMMKIKASTGYITVSGVSAGEIDLSVSTGNVNASSISCGGDIKVKVSTGKTNLSGVECKNLISEGDTGDITLEGVVASAKFDIERSTGDIKFEGSDASEIFVKTDTGDVTGTLLSDKVFIVKTDTGKIKVPNSIVGGRCEIETDTGDVKIDITSAK